MIPAGTSGHTLNCKNRRNNPGKRVSGKHQCMHRRSFAHRHLERTWPLALMTPYLQHVAIPAVWESFREGKPCSLLMGVSMLGISTWWVCSFFSAVRFWATGFASWSWWRLFKAFSRRRDWKAFGVLQRPICLHFESSLLCVLVNQQKCSRIPLCFILFDPLYYYAIFTMIRSCQNSTVWYPHYRTSLLCASSDSAINESY